MHIVDVIFLIILFVLQPIYGAYSYNKYLSDVAAGNASDRISLYRETFIEEWGALFVLLLVWLLLERPFADLGLVSSSQDQVWRGAGIITVLVAVFLFSWLFVKNMSEQAKLKQREGLGQLIHFLPQNSRETNYMIGLSFTAGIVEEIVYRGFLFWVLSLYLPIWAVVLVSSVGFGLAHSYQGVAGMLKTMSIGMFFAWIYLRTGSIWFPILAHILFDILQLPYMRELIRTKALT